MLGYREILIEFENAAAPWLRQVTLIGEIPFADIQLRQIEKALSELVRLEGAAQATSFINDRTPCTVACFLVWKGICGYREGNYWEEVCDSVGLPRQNWSQYWGEIFRRVLRRYGLPDFRETGAHIFVTPILIHGGIPDYCLDDFFERLIWPAVTGKLNYTGDLQNLLAEWRDSSLHYNIDKPVLYFLEHGGKVAADFLERCLDMALTAYEEGDMPASKEFKLPERVPERFASWLKRNSLEGSIKPQQSIGSTRYRAPQILLNAAAGCLLLSFPTQKFPRDILEGGRLAVQLQRNGSFLTELPVRAAIKGDLIETDPFEFDFGAPAERWELLLISGEKPLHKWAFDGINQNRPWMIFHGWSGKLLLARTIAEKDFWIVFPQSWGLSTTVQPIEATSLFGDYEAKHLNFAKGSFPNIQLLGPKGESVSVPIEWTEVAALITERASRWAARISSGEFEVYWESLPEICIPLPVGGQGPMIPAHWRLTIIPAGDTWPAEKREISLQSIFDLSYKKQGCLSVPLKDPRLLGPTPCGRFAIQLRGRLGEDTTFRVCVLPETNFNFPQEGLLPDPSTGSQDYSFTMESPYLGKLEAEPAIQVEYHASSSGEGKNYRVVVPARSRQALLRSHFFSDKGTVEMPLEITIPRVRWAVSGAASFGHLKWHDTPIKVSLQEFEEAPEPRLLVQGDFDQDVNCILHLRGIGQQRSFNLKEGKGGCPLSPFLDSLRKSGFARTYFDLEIALPGQTGTTQIPLIQVETRWIIEGLQVKQEPIPNDHKRITFLCWRDKGRVNGRLLRLWNLYSQSTKPIEVSIEDGKSEVVVEKDLSDFSHGRYRLEFAVRDPWGGLPSVSPDPYSDNVFDIELQEDGVTIYDSPLQPVEALIEKIVAATSIAEISLGPQALRVFAARPELGGSFCYALYTRDNKKGDGLEVFQQLLQQCGNEQDTFAGSLARSILDHTWMKEVAQFLARSLVRSGFLSRPWEANLGELLLSATTANTSQGEEEMFRQAQDAIPALYAHSTWQSFDAAKRFLGRLVLIDKTLVYKEKSRKTQKETHHTLLKLEGVERRDRDALLRWSCQGGSSFISIPLREVTKILPRHMPASGVLFLTATLQRATVHGVLSFPTDMAEKVSFWGTFFWQERGREYTRELRRAEDTFAPDGG